MKDGVSAGIIDLRPPYVFAKQQPGSSSRTNAGGWTVHFAFAMTAPKRKLQAISA
jgi:hypothetical protein